MRHFFLSVVLFSLSCGVLDDDFSPSKIDGVDYRKKIYYLEAPCTIKVTEIGNVNIEDEYIAGVISCENPHAPYEALKAQAVEARTFLFYKMFIEGKTEIRNSTSDQVFRCAHAPNGPTAEHIRAANETKGQYLSWNNSVIASFFVAGAIPPNPNASDPFHSCIGTGGSDGTHTEKWVTYNKGKTACDVKMTKLGWTTSDCYRHPVNRGCASQNGHACLAQLNVPYEDQFAFYYGDDIKLSKATGACGAPVDPPDPYDAFCSSKNDATYCYDNASTIHCVGNASERVEQCDFGCENNACKSAPVSNICTSRADGGYCDGTQSITCVSNEVDNSEACAYQCENGVCKSKPADVDFCGTRADGKYCDGPKSVSCSAGKVSLSILCQLGCSGGVCNTNNATGNNTQNNDNGNTNNSTGNPIHTDPKSDESLVSVSNGISGGCNVTSTPSSPKLAIFSVLLMGLFFGRRCKKTA